MRLNTAQGNAADASQIERLQVSLSTIAGHSCPCCLHLTVCGRETHVLHAPTAPQRNAATAQREMVKAIAQVGPP